ncbi:MAG: hypothetical protein IK079_05140 [Desulfovibrio sp.]|nr:hypothetical protein [Desulfovibrio sp.]
MSVSQRKDGRWCVKYKENGVWKQKIFKANAEKEAQKFNKEKLEELAEEQNKDEPMTFGELVVAFYSSNERNSTTKKMSSMPYVGMKKKVNISEVMLNS